MTRFRPLQIVLPARFIHIKSFRLLSLVRASCVIILLVAGAPLKAAVFERRDAERLIAINGAIQTLEQDVATKMKALPPFELEKIASGALIELSLEAAQERLGSVINSVIISVYMESTNDQLRVLNLLYDESLPSAKLYIKAKSDKIVSIGSASASDAYFASYGSRASELLNERTVPLLDELYRRIAVLRK